MSQEVMISTYSYRHNRKAKIQEHPVAFVRVGDTISLEAKLNVTNGDVSITRIFEHIIHVERIEGGGVYLRMASATERPELVEKKGGG